MDSKASNKEGIFDQDCPVSSVLQPSDEEQEQQAETDIQDQEDLKQKITELEEQIASLKDSFLRAKADAQNTERRSKEEIAAANKFAIAKCASDLLSVKDSLEMALKDESNDPKNIKIGVDMTLKQLSSIFDRFNLKEINPLGEKLDPDQHQAISVVDDESEENTIVQVMQKGYKLHDRVLRPATVVVSNGKADQSNKGQQDDPPVLDVEIN